MLFSDYLPAELKKAKSRWYVSYYAKNPATGKLHRKTIKVNRIQSKRERERYAKKIISEINRKLETGWNPFLEQEAPKAFTRLTDAVDTFLRSKEKEFDSADSIRSYRSQASIFQTYIKDVRKAPEMYVINFTVSEAKDYLDYVYNVKNLSNKTLNNYKAFCRTMFNFFIENQYSKVNPFQGIRNKKESKKKRIIIDRETRNRIKEHLEKKGETEFLAIVMLTYYGLIRGKEILLLKPENIRLGKNLIFLTPDMTKDDDTRVVSITEELKKQLTKLNINSIPADNYIFSSGFKPGKKTLTSRDISRRWARLRDEIGMPAEYQFYSLKDTGIVQMLQDGVNALDVRNQAGHSSLEETNKYAVYANPEGSAEIRDKMSKF